MHPKDGDQYPIGSRVLWLKKNKKATIIDHGFVYDNKQFLNYYLRLDDGTGPWPAYHDDLEILPPEAPDKISNGT